MNQRSPLAIGVNRLFFFLTSVVLFSACSMMNPVDLVKALEERAVQFAEILNNHDMEGYYSFMNPAYRETHTIDQFKSRKHPVYENVAFNRIDWKDDTHATVYYTTDMQIMGFKFDQTRFSFPFELTPDGWFITYEDFYNSL